MHLEQPHYRSIAALLITVTFASAVGRILSTLQLWDPSLFRDESAADDWRRPWPRTRPEPMPTFGSNDRSRWATVRALVDEGTFVIGTRDRQTTLLSALAPLGGVDALQAGVLLEAGFEARVRSDRGIVFEDGWTSVDKVLHPQRLEFYSTKPPLLTLLAAGEYYLLKKAFGWSLTAQRWEVVRVTLLTFNGLPLLIYLWLLARLAERYGRTDWGRLFVLISGCFATLLTPFVMTFNNHTPAAYCAMAALYLTLRLGDYGGRPLPWWNGSIPPGRQPPFYLFILCGLLAGFAVGNELPALALAAALFVLLVPRFPLRTLAGYLPAAAVPVAVLFVANYLALGQWRPAYSEFGGPWYEYEGSNWRPAPPEFLHGIDWAKTRESRATYAFHLLLGHHGLFSLTPIILLSAAGMVLGTLGGFRRDNGDGAGRLPYFVYPLTLALTIVLVGFYLVKSDNYGGVSPGPRWLLWLTPFFLVTLLPVADRLGLRRWGRVLALVLLALSVLSASYPTWNAWRHPWIYNWMEAHGWINY